jgi:hypothetical protein
MSNQTKGTKQMKRITFALALIALAATPALAWEEHTIETVKGSAIIIDDGRVFEPSNGDDVSSWEDGDTVLISDDGKRMIDKDNGDDPIDVEETK